MQINRFIFVFLTCCFLISCSAVDPRDMAAEFCKCINEESDIQKCTELAREHKEALAGDKDKIQKYADEVLNCTNVSD